MESVLRSILDKLEHEQEHGKIQSLYGQAAAEIRKAYEATGKTKKEWRISDLSPQMQELVKRTNTMFYAQVKGLIYKYVLDGTYRTTYDDIGEEIINEAVIGILKEFPFYSGKYSIATFVYVQARHAIAVTLAAEKGITLWAYMAGQISKRIAQKLEDEGKEVTPESIAASDTTRRITAESVRRLRKLEILPVQDYLDREHDNYSRTPESIAIRHEEREEARKTAEWLMSDLNEREAAALYLIEGLGIKGDTLDRSGRYDWLYPAGSKVRRARAVKGVAMMKARQKIKNKEGLKYASLECEADTASGIRLAADI